MMEMMPMEMMGKGKMMEMMPMEMMGKGKMMEMMPMEMMGKGKMMEMMPMEMMGHHSSLSTHHFHRHHSTFHLAISLGKGQHGGNCDDEVSCHFCDKKVTWKIR
jgi:hypothetical protein